MTAYEEPVRVHRRKQVAGERRADPGHILAKGGRCPGAAAQLAAVHRVLRHGPVVQLKAGGAAGGAPEVAAPRAAQAHRTGLPDKLKSGVEALSGVSLDGVKVHYNSSKPAQLDALAYAQGSDIHLAPGQERNLPHEAWHIVQQAQGRVKSSTQLKGGAPVNLDEKLETEADIMGAKAMAGASTVYSETGPAKLAQPLQANNRARNAGNSGVVQRVLDWMLKLVDMAKANPVTSLATIGIGAAGILAYYFLKRQAPRPGQPALQAPPIDTIQGLSAALGVDSATLLAQLNSQPLPPGVDPIDIFTFGRSNIQPNETGTVLVPQQIISGLPGAPAGKVDEIFNRLNQRGFVYTGQANYIGFLSNSGDCMTLAYMLKLAAEAAGVPDVQIRSGYVPMLVAARPIHGRNIDHNVEGEPFWFFDNHHWCEYNGQIYDVLFMTRGLPPVHLENATPSYRGKSYSVFANGRAFIGRDSLPLNIDNAMQGYVAQNEQALREIIDDNM